MELTEGVMTFSHSSVSVTKESQSICDTASCSTGVSLFPSFRWWESFHFPLEENLEVSAEQQHMRAKLWSFTSVSMAPEEPESACWPPHWGWLPHWGSQPETEGGRGERGREGERGGD